MILIFARKFRKQLLKHSAAVQERCKDRLALFAREPFHPTLRNHALEGKLAHYRSINITGNLRAVYDPIDETTARFFAFGTHSELYE